MVLYLVTKGPDDYNKSNFWGFWWDAERLRVHGQYFLADIDKRAELPDTRVLYLKDMGMTESEAIRWCDGAIQVLHEIGVA